MSCTCTRLVLLSLLHCLFHQDGKSSDQLFPIDQPETEPATKVEEVEEFVKPAAKPLVTEEEKEEKVTKKKKKKKEEAQTMKIVKKDNKDELCMQEYEDLCYTPIRIDTIDMGKF